LAQFVVNDNIKYQMFKVTDRNNIILCYSYNRYIILEPSKSRDVCHWQTLVLMAIPQTWLLSNQLNNKLTRLPRRTSFNSKLTSSVHTFVFFPTSTIYSLKIDRLTWEIITEKMWPGRLPCRWHEPSSGQKSFAKRGGLWWWMTTGLAIQRR